MGPLHPEAAAELQKSGITLDSAQRNGLASVQPSDHKQCGIDGVSHALAFHYHSINGTPTGLARWKLFYNGDPTGKPKYWQPKGTDSEVYLPLLCDWLGIAQDQARPIVIPEGEKKAIAGAQLGLSCLGIAGVWCWRAKLDTGERLVLPTLDQFVWKGRTVELVPDSDAWRPEKERDILAG